MPLLDDRVQVGFVADRRAAMPLAVTVASLLRHLAPAAGVDLHVAHLDFPEKLRRRIDRIVARRPGAALHWRAAPADRLDGLPTVAHLPPVTFLRLHLPRLLPAIGRLIYLDGDLVVRRDVSELWATDLGGAAVGAVVDPDLPPLGDRAEGGVGYALAELPPGTERDPMFNGGVMLMDLNRWRSESVGERALAFARRHAASLRWADQDALNAVLAGRWRPLAESWNVKASRRAGHPYWASNGLGVRLGEIDRPAVYHFVGGNKPWGGGGPRHPFRRAYSREVAASGWHALAVAPLAAAGRWAGMLARSVHLRLRPPSFPNGR